MALLGAPDVILNGRQDGGHLLFWILLKVLICPENAEVAETDIFF